MFINYPSLYCKKNIVIIGAYGSGKSEIAVNLAINMAESESDKGVKLFLADLDIINPFYRSFDAAKILEYHNIKMIASRFANTNVEAPSVPSEISSIIRDGSYRGVLDIGGEDMGARILSVLKDEILSESYELLMAINMYRPFTRNIIQINKMLAELEEASGIKVTGLINNSNLLEQSTTEDLIETNALLQNIAQTVGVPLVFASGFDHLLPSEWSSEMPDGTPLLRLQRTITYLE